MYEIQQIISTIKTAAMLGVSPFVAALLIGLVWKLVSLVQKTRRKIAIMRQAESLKR